MRKLALVVLLAAPMQHANAQRPTSAPHFVLSRASPHSRAFLYTIPFVWDSLDSEAQLRYPAPSQPGIIVLQPPPATPEPVAVPAESLLIELTGGRYLRVTSEAPAEAATIDRRPGPAFEPVGSSDPAIPSQDLAPAVLVFRDGHREEVAAYTIVDSVLYAQGNYYTDGSWNRKIDLSSLNLPETIEASRSRGVPFRLPSAPNEVVTRP